MKKFLLAALSVMMVFAVVSCGEDEPSNDAPVQTGDGTFTITFNANLTGATPATFTVKTQKANANGQAFIGAVNWPTPPKADGKVFKEWKMNQDGSGATFSATTSVTKDTTVYATWNDGSRVDFDKNHNDAADWKEADPTWKAVVSPDTTVGTLPKEPTRGGGNAFVGWNTRADGTGTDFDEDTTVTASITVYAQWVKGTAVIFHDNDGVHNHSVSVVVREGDDYDPDDTPAGPKNEKEYFEFYYWSYNKDPKESEYGTVDAKVFDPNDVDLEDGDVNVYACWKFVGGKPVVTGTGLAMTMTITKPLFVVGGSATAEENTIDFPETGSGTASFTFPAAADANAADYDYLIVTRSMVSGQAQGANIYALNTTTPYPALPVGGLNNASNPWLSNNDWLLRAVYGPGTNPGDPPVANTGMTIRAGNSANGAGKITISSITFYKAPKWDVDFDWNYEGDNADFATDFPTPAPLTGVIGKTTHIDGPGVGSANWPAGIVPGDCIEGPTGDGTDDFYFLGWAEKNTDPPVYYNATTGLTKNTSLVGVWTDKSPPMDRLVTVRHNHQAAFYFPWDRSDVTWEDIKKITMTIRITGEVSNTLKSGSVRRHIVYIGKEGDTPTADGGKNFGNTGWGGNRIMNIAEGGLAAMLGVTSDADYQDKWVTLVENWDVQADYKTQWDALKVNTANNKSELILGVGLAVNANNTAGNIPLTYYIKDVALQFESGDDIKANVNKGNASHYWAHVASNHPAVVATWVPEPVDE